MWLFAGRLFGKGSGTASILLSHCTIHKRNLIPIILERSRQIERYTLFPRVLKKEKEILEVVLNQR